MRRRIVTFCFVLAAALLAALPVAAAEASTPAPRITLVSPMRVKVGAVMVIRGRHFSISRRRNTVIFRASNGRAAFVKPFRATSRRLALRIPGAVTRLLSRRSGLAVPTRLRLRVVVRRKYSRLTPRRLSPVVVPVSPGSGGNAAAGCGSGSDPDHDLLPTSLEGVLRTDPCVADTDGDGIQDGFEYRSAVDLNNDDYQQPNQSLPYPGRRPYPNPLDPSDANVDYDGDGLAQSVEQRLWNYTVSQGAARTLSPLTYSDGLQYSVYAFHTGQGDRRFPALPAAGYSKEQNFVNWATARGYRTVFIPADPEHNVAAGYYGLFDLNLNGSESSAEVLRNDVDHNGWLSDDERDEDADGLDNFDETRGRMQPTYWASCYDKEKPYYVQYAGTDPANADSDGDGVRDGADDQDHDDVPNVMELSRIASFNKHGAVYGYDPLEGAGDDREFGQDCKLKKAINDLLAGVDPPIYWHNTAYGRVNPYNPCLPFRNARTCSRYTSFGIAWAPFDQSPNWFALN